MTNLNIRTLAGGLVIGGVGISYIVSVCMRKWCHSVPDGSRGSNDCSDDDNDDNEEDLKLSPLQAMFMEFQNGGNDHIVCCVEIEGKIPTERQLLKSIQLLKRRHTSLQTILALGQGNDIRLRNERDDDPIKSGELTIVRDQTWDEVVQSYLDDVPFPKPTSTSPITSGWKLSLVTAPSLPKEEKSSAVIVFCFNHVLFDGTSRNRFVHEFFCTLRTEYEENLRNQTSLPLIDVRRLSETVPTMSWARFTWNMAVLVARELWNLRSVCYFPLTREHTPGLKVQNKAPPTTKMCMWTLSEKETTRLAQRSRSEKTTIHGALSAAGHRALVRLANEMSHQTPCSINRNSFFSSGHLISLWPRVSDSLSSMYPNGASIGGLLIDIYTVRVCTALDQDPWCLARDIKAQLQQYQPLNHFQRLVQTRLFNFLQSFSQRPPPEHKILDRNEWAFFISNNGRADALERDYAGTQIKSLFVTTSHPRMSGALAFFSVQTIHGRMHIALSYYTQIWSKETAERFVELVQQELQAMVE